MPRFAHADEQLLNIFQVDLKPGDEPPFPDVRGFAKVSDPRG